MRRSRALAALLGLTWLACGCTSSTSSSAHSPDQPYDPSVAEPPPLLVHTAHGKAEVRPWTYCWRTPGQAQCADGSPRPPYADAAPGSLATFEFHASPGWRFHTYFRRSGRPCAAAYAVEATRVSGTRWRVPPAGPAGTWLVEVHGNGPEGDVAATFRWRTTRSGRGTRVEPGPECARSY